MNNNCNYLRFVVLLILISVCNFNLSAYDQDTIPSSIGLIWKYYPSGVTIVGTNKPHTTRLEIPDSVGFYYRSYGERILNMKKVTGVSIDGSFDGDMIENGYLTYSPLYNSEISSVSVPDGAKYISMDCLNYLTSVNIPRSIENVNLFNCPNLTSLSFPSSFKELRIGECENFTINVIPDVDFFDFRDCPSIKKHRTASSQKNLWADMGSCNTF